MIFTIVNMISFRREDGLMWNNQFPDRRVSFTTIPNRLFSYLLEHTDKIVSREELLDNIWTTYGLEPSNNSVNQYISLIRSSLNELGCDQEIIKTIPRTGFYISGELISFEHGSNIKNDTIGNTNQNLEKASGNTYKINSPFLYLSLFISILLVLQPVFTYLGVFDYNFPKSILFKIGNVGKCSVYSLNYTSPDTAVAKVKLAKVIADAHAPCVNSGLYIFHPSVHYVYHESGRVFITRCLNDDKNLSNFSFCKAVYVFNK
ncbi:MULTISPECIES: winged helix-turn-helix domain-containing protein [Enterobacteriaceae]|uniref:winged helix-turn-helix domain-containing protein n=1 Tax=Enterobacteriaceae TaxID=543 RepID=UPI001A1A7F1D|nr:MULTISPECIES: helix-turn-helix domain-containing protein [Klebsiella]QUE99288.1 winged helix-turn-helix domain-containing protein [Klebsiella pasteurii]GKO93694.1 transcriptional regulator [Klebsiella quasipneumoniae]HAT3652283.1 helix-turn-helix domain-containing protein [Raoultella ornithinolytica]HCI9061451.1 winged helix-turn-helix domain-containing protein [Klebsiella quasipneumoniae]